MIEVIFSALFTAVMLGFTLTGILAFVEDYRKEDKTLIGKCWLVSAIGGMVIVAGGLIWLVWGMALAQ